MEDGISKTTGGDMGRKLQRCLNVITRLTVEENKIDGYNHSACLGLIQDLWPLILLVNGCFRESPPVERHTGFLKGICEAYTNYQSSALELMDKGCLARSAQRQVHDDVDRAR